MGATLRLNGQRLRGEKTRVRIGDLEAARLITYRSAWLRDRQGPSAEATAAMFRAKYMVGVATSRLQTQPAERTTRL